MLLGFMFLVRDLLSPVFTAERNLPLERFRASHPLPRGERDLPRAFEFA